MSRVMLGCGILRFNKSQCYSGNRREQWDRSQNPLIFSESGRCVMNFSAMKTLVLLSIVLFAGCIGTSNERPNPVKAEDPNSIYHRLGGQPAIDAAVELFYIKVLADKTVNHHFEGINMAKQKTRQKQFLAAAFGGAACPNSCTEYAANRVIKPHRPKVQPVPFILAS